MVANYICSDDIKAFKRWQDVGYGRRGITLQTQFNL